MRQNACSKFTPLCYERDLALLKGNDNPYRDSLSRRGLKLVKRKEGGGKRDKSCKSNSSSRNNYHFPHRVYKWIFRVCRTLSDVSRSSGYIISAFYYKSHSAGHSSSSIVPGHFNFQPRCKFLVCANFAERGVETVEAAAAAASTRLRG